MRFRLVGWKTRRGHPPDGGATKECRRIRAFVESVVDEGTTVYVVLPFKLPGDLVFSHEMRSQRS